MLGIFYLVFHNQLLIYELKHGADIPGNLERAATGVIYYDLRLRMRGHLRNRPRTQKDAIWSRGGEAETSKPGQVPHLWKGWQEF